MIKSVRIKNFQSHRLSEFNFAAPGVNVIVGPTDAGKSAVFRALLWVLFNRPLGDGMRSYWAEEDSAEVDAVLVDGTVLRRVKGKTVNEYWLNKTVLRAFGQDPPEEILRAHSLDRTLNVQSQIDPFFLLQSSPGEVAVYLNRVAGLDDIDRVTRGLQSHSRQVQQEISVQQQRCSELKDELVQYEGLELVGAEIEQGENLEASISGKRASQHQVASLIDKIQTVRWRIDQRRERLSIKPHVEKLFDLHGRLQKSQIEYRQVSHSVRGIQHLQTKIGKDREKLKIAPEVDASLDLLDRIQQSRTSLTSTSRIVHAILRQEEELQDRRRQLKQSEERFHKAMPEGSQCPLCGQQIERRT